MKTAHKFLQRLNSSTVVITTEEKNISFIIEKFNKFIESVFILSQCDLWPFRRLMSFVWSFELGFDRRRHFKLIKFALVKSQLPMTYMMHVY